MECCFLSFQSTTKSHSLGANVQTVLSLMKAHNPALCNAAARRAQKRQTHSAPSTSTSDSDNAFDELLTGLQDEFGHITLYVSNNFTCVLARPHKAVVLSPSHDSSKRKSRVAGNDGEVFRPRYESPFLRPCHVTQ